MEQGDTSFELIESPKVGIGSSMANSIPPIDEFDLKKYQEEDDYQFGEDYHQLDFAPVTLEKFESFFDSSGRISKEREFRESIFQGGCDKAIRHKVWPFLFGEYPLSSTASDRKQINVGNHYRYHALRIRCAMFMKGWNGEEDQDAELVDESIPPYADDSISESSLQNQESLARIYAFSKRTEIENVFAWHRIIKKDIPRTDCSHPCLQSKSKEVLRKMKVILTVFGFFHPDIGYVQGMNDLLMNFMVVFDSEVDAYWCFSNYMNSVQEDFDEKGMLDKVQLVRGLLQKLEPNLYSHFEDCFVHELVFCHRWLLIAFKREFEHEDALKYFEIIRSGFLDLNLDVSNQIRRLQISKNDNKDDEDKRSRGRSLVDTGYTYDVFVCVALIMIMRQDFLACKESSDVFRVATAVRAGAGMDLRRIHLKSYSLYTHYVRRAADDSLARSSGNLGRNVLDKMSRVFKLKWRG